MAEDIRWLQRLDNFKRSMVQLEQAVTLSKQRALSDLEQQGLIQAFEYNYELAWNVIKDFYSYQGDTEDIQGSRDAFRTAFNRGLVTEGQLWMDMIKSRNKTSHTYNEETADDIFMKIVHEYHQEFNQFKNRMEELENGEGRVQILSNNGDDMREATRRIRQVAFPPQVEEGAEYEGKVKSVKDFGCFVEILPGTDGLIHISEFSWEKVAKMEDVCKEGDSLKFKVVGKDPKTKKWKLSRKVLLPRPERKEEAPQAN